MFFAMRMIEGEKDVKKTQFIYDASTYYIYIIHNSSESLTTYLLTGDNYDTWSKAIMNELEGRNTAGMNLLILNPP